jgi:16S rRNA (guanine966-N2)-methyltransferase
MRVVGGSARGRKLKRVPGETTRPIMDRVKENLFNILGPWVAGTVWLDLFAGTGQVGIEALSRGAESATFVDSARVAVGVVKENLSLTGFADRASVVQSDAFAFLRAGAFEPFDVIYIAPPQYRGLWLKALAMCDESVDQCLTGEGMVIVQIDPKEYEEIPMSSLTLFDQRRYGRTMLAFYERL